MFPSPVAPVFPSLRKYDDDDYDAQRRMIASARIVVRKHGYSWPISRWVKQGEGQLQRGIKGSMRVPQVSVQY